MRTIPFITSDLVLFRHVEELKQSTESIDAEIAQVASAKEALEFMNVETPDLALINFSDPVIDAFALLDSILQDPWLHHAGIIGFCVDPDIGDQLEKRAVSTWWPCFATTRSSVICPGS